MIRLVLGVALLVVVIGGVLLVVVVMAREGPVEPPADAAGARWAAHYRHVAEHARGLGDVDAAAAYDSLARTYDIETGAT